MTPLTFTTLMRIAGRHYRREPGIAENENPLSYCQKLERALRLEFSRSGIDRAESC